MTTRLFVPPETSSLPLSLPPVAPEPARPGFPYLAAIAPVAASLVLWFATGSVASLAFAALGPLLAVATMLDARRQVRRSVRVAEEGRAAALDGLRNEVGRRHAHEAGELWSRHPPAAVLVDGGAAPHWGRDVSAPVVLGSATVQSAIRIEGSPADDLDRAVLDLARRLEHAPVVVEVRDGIGLVGPANLVIAAARALVVQVAEAVAPDVVSFAVPDGAAWTWAGALPHAGPARIVVRDPEQASASPAAAGSRSRGGGAVPGGGPAAEVVIALAADASLLPPGLGVVVTILGPRTATLARRGDGGVVHLVPGMLGVEQAATWATRAAGIAARQGFAGGTRLPALLPVAELPTPARPGHDRSTLSVAVGRTASGILELDLVADGPHAIVAGTTGSGKSEFLLAWIRQLAAAHPPERVAFLLVDFKGGAAFEPVAVLPHVAGIVTDLEESEAERAVLSLRAELRHRERVLRDAGVRDIGLLDADVPLGRLVVVIDEFQAMVQRFRELGAVISDIAARGRSLGVHLVLASQRPNGVLGDQVTANAAIRVSLRVMNRADSMVIVGTDEAALIPVDRPGRGVVDRGDGTPTPFQSAIADASSIEQVRRVFAGSDPVRRPWLDPLPHLLEPAALAASVRESAIAVASDRLAFGLLDEPDLQRRSVATWSPEEDGSLLVLGAPGSGRSTTLTALETAMRDRAAVEVTRLGGRPAEDWAALIELAQAVRVEAPHPRLLLADDLDACLAAWPDEYRHAAVAALEHLLREGRRHGIAVAASATLAHRLGGGVRELFGSVLHLRHASRSELAHAGGSPDLWHRDDPPGAGQWRSRRLQVVAADPGPSRPAPRPAEVDLLASGLVAIATATPQRDLVDLRAAGHAPLLLVPGGERQTIAAIAADEHVVVVGDAEAWASAFSLTSRVRDASRLIVHGGSREFRALAPTSAGRTGSVALPPLLADADRECWQIEPGGRAVRRVWKTTETAPNVRSGN
ncbi:FtsK/SpoIIIE domain-containing protein [Agromyces salentinus]|uniref:FtsK domain-containing protein n=1 Tax=Agromyces salentinus TaxID=269421 RepID=A0ABN2MWJ0_9MICO|nr:FtsK/SpoIIIE domain-containing protein [Agromyces salentinus]